jgi:phosphoribosylamine--glycine ligase
MAENADKLGQNGALPPRTPVKFLFVSIDALISDLAWQVGKEGHEVKYYVQDKGQKDVGSGFVEKVDDWKPLAEWADVIVFDDIGFGDAAQKLRKDGKAVVGGSCYTDRLEFDREFGQNEMKGAGISLLPHWDFSDFDSALKFIKENPGRYVIKPSGTIQDEKELSFVGQDEDGKDLIEILELYKTSWAGKIKSFQLQKFASGVEVAVGAFFNGEDFIYPVNINFEHKKLFPGGLGPNTGEMGTSMFWSPPNKLFQETLGRMKDRLGAAGYVGYIDINCIANNRGIYPLEFTSRFGYPTISIQMEGVLSEWGQFLAGIARGEKPELRTKKGFQLGVVIAVPPFPFTDPKTYQRYSEDAAILLKKPTDGVHLGEVKLVDGKWLLAGESGYALIVTGSGTTMEDARKQAYLRVANIMIPNMFYRTDIGARWTGDSDRLQTWGYLY